uniref:Putative secreted protein n=1 Tax=Anopheles darlingi TaxID=43151 RepID=A0A2M4DBU7_ANODA
MRRRTTIPAPKQSGKRQCFCCCCCWSALSGSRAWTRASHLPTIPSFLPAPTSRGHVRKTCSERRGH